jgi:Flp pilus assembly protein TadG
MAVVFFLLAMLGLYAGRVSDAEADVQSAAANAARAASIEATPAGATEAASDVARANLASDRVTCAAFSVDVDTSTLRPGGSVSITVECTTDNSDIVLLAVPGQRRFQSTATEIVDTYRGGP